MEILIIGAGVSGLTTAISLKEKYPDYLIQHKVKQISSEIFEPIYLTHSAYEREMMGFLQ